MRLLKSLHEGKELSVVVHVANKRKKRLHKTPVLRTLLSLWRLQHRSNHNPRSAKAETAAHDAECKPLLLLKHKNQRTKVSANISKSSPPLHEPDCFFWHFFGKMKGLCIFNISQKIAKRFFNKD
jgi:hypothetical protein